MFEIESPKPSSSSTSFDTLSSLVTVTDGCVETFHDGQQSGAQSNNSHLLLCAQFANSPFSIEISRGDFRGQVTLKLVAKSLPLWHTEWQKASNAHPCTNFTLPSFSFNVVRKTNGWSLPFPKLDPIQFQQNLSDFLNEKVKFEAEVEKGTKMTNDERVRCRLPEEATVKKENEKKKDKKKAEKKNEKKTEEKRKETNIETVLQFISNLPQITKQTVSLVSVTIDDKIHTLAVAEAAGSDVSEEASEEDEKEKF